MSPLVLFCSLFLNEVALLCSRAAGYAGVPGIPDPTQSDGQGPLRQPAAAPLRPVAQHHYPDPQQLGQRPCAGQCKEQGKGDCLGWVGLGWIPSHCDRLIMAVQKGNGI